MTTYRIKGHREAGADVIASEWTLLAAAGQPAEFNTKEEAERIVTMCNAALAHASPRIWYTVEEAPEIRPVPIAYKAAPEPLLPRYGGLVADYSPIYVEEWRADDTGAPLTT